MPTASKWPAGQYVLTAGLFRQYPDGPDGDFVEFHKGDVVTLNATDAERLGDTELPVIEKPGEREAYELAELEAAVAAAKARQQQTEQRRREAESAAQSAKKPHSSPGTGPAAGSSNR